MSQPPIHPIYTRELPPLAELEGYSLPQLQGFVKHVEDDVALLAEECRMFAAAHAAHLQKEKELHAAAVRVDDEEVDDAGFASGGGKRRGRTYRRKSSEPRNVRLTLDDKNSIAAAEAERLKTEKERSERAMEDARELFRASLEEGHNRVKELKMELAFFRRETIVEKEGVSAEKVLKYIDSRPVELQRHVDKTREKVKQMQQHIAKSQSQLRQREDVGDAFHQIDFSQLQIENHQFLERIEQKNAELVELKGTTTRTVQTLNSLTDRLNALTTEQHQLLKEERMRREHADKLRKEIKDVQREGTTAQAKNTALKIQHESVKVPKVEDYIAQKAEAYELQKAVQNWQRKVEIASGHVAVMKQQMLSLRKQRTITR